jgi:hypothetical protein
MMIGFDAGLTAVNYGVLLQPGEVYMTTDYNGAISALATILNENINFIEI